MDSVADLVDLRAREDPSALAIVDGERTLCYGDLNRRADAVARELRALGVERDAIVGLYAPRSAMQLTGALGILRAGAAFLPLDPTLPRERAQFQLLDARAAALVLGADDDAIGFDERAVRLRTDGELARPATSAPQPDGRSVAAAGDLAYVLYTSGTTGRPKGVEITLGNLANLIAWHRRAFHVSARDRASHIASVGFDASVWEVWPYLTAGAAVYVADDDVVKDPEALRDWFVSSGITIGFAATPLAERLVELPWPAQTQLRALLTGADTLKRYPPASLPFALVNNYGPTETTVVATSGLVPAATGSSHASERLPSLGAPISGVRVYVLDERLAPVRDGDEGEIWIAGAGVARGYAGRPELTRERFVTDPFAAGTERMYRSGDRGRMLPGGEIAFAGRLDEQIKVRGFRIEAGEVEAALNAHPAVAQSVVVAPGDERLVAYAVAKPGMEPRAPENVHHFLATRLPSYMIPSSVAWLPALPLTANGKFDRVALRAREPDDAATAERYVAPRTPVEEKLVRIVAPLLKLERVSVEDNFFMLGGHSLLGTQVIARVRDAFGVKIGLRYLFESPTVAALALEVERLTSSGFKALDGEPATVIPKRSRS